MNVSILPPSDCAAKDLAAFEGFVIAGGAVQSTGLTDLIRQAFQLAFLRTPVGDLAGIAALKNPRAGYRTKVFRQAASTIISDAYKFEFGWVFIACPHRGQGLSRRITSELLPYAGNELIYATTRTDEFAMQHVLDVFGFHREGKPYPSDKGDHDLILYVRPS